MNTQFHQEQRFLTFTYKNYICNFAYVHKYFNRNGTIPHILLEAVNISQNVKYYLTIAENFYSIHCNLSSANNMHYSCNVTNCFPNFPVEGALLRIFISSYFFFTHLPGLSLCYCPTSLFQIIPFTFMVTITILR